MHDDRTKYNKGYGKLVLSLEPSSEDVMGLNEEQLGSDLDYLDVVIERTPFEQFALPLAQLLHRIGW